MTPYLIVGAIAAVITYTTTPIVRWIVLKAGAIDYPHDRKVHARPTPTLGGVAILLGVIGGGAAAALLPGFGPVFKLTSEPLGIGAAALVIVVLGAVDDLKDLPVPVKVAGQVFAAGLLFLSGVKVRFVVTPDTPISLSDDVSVIVTVTWILVMINAVNLADGLDGLAAGVVAIAAASFFVYVYELFQTGALGPGPSAPLVAIIVVGASLGFLRHNFYPARIFMGDSGAMLLGLLLGAAPVGGVGGAPFVTSSSFLLYVPLLIPLSVLAIPFLDAVLAILRRTWRRQSIFLADKEHLHHRLMDLGHGHRQAVIVMYVWSALAAGAGLGFTFLERSDLIFVFPVAVGAIVVYTLFPVLTKAITERFTP
ncbi:MAG: undecaprenyl/decaprenyl-phosphate alpha-N-acetylglucosaminyl 1-phosphate transferase [Actinobacteria bacterium]|nr:undecaprenyl/decaprenyl-phosphate alpha-N-acetylglucosaminyl 1-phosphate transferase [Actinomycetota bacterium]